MSLNGGLHTIVVIAYNASGQTASAPFAVAPSANPGGPYAGASRNGRRRKRSGLDRADRNTHQLPMAMGRRHREHLVGVSLGVARVRDERHVYRDVDGHRQRWCDRIGDHDRDHFESGLCRAIPTGPTPTTGATGVATTATLTWSATGATSYDVSFGTANPPPQVTTGQAAGVLSACDDGGWRQRTTGAWWRATRRHRRPGPVWSFTTAAAAGLAGALADPGYRHRRPSRKRVAFKRPVHGARRGSDIWGSTDAFRFVYQPLTGDGQIIARITGIQDTHSFAKAGVMIRESLERGLSSRDCDTRPSGAGRVPCRGRRPAGRRRLGGATQALPRRGSGWRGRGTSIVASVSANGSTWSVVGTVNVPMASSGLVGLAVTQPRRERPQHIDIRLGLGYRWRRDAVARDADRPDTDHWRHGCGAGHDIDLERDGGDVV